MRPASATPLVVSLIVLANLGQSTPEVRKAARDSCIALLSGFPKDVPLPPKLPYPADLTGVTLEYFASGCYGNCPAFTLTISKDIAHFDGRAFVRAKGKRTSKLSQQQFETFLHAWYDGNFNAMRENYCDVHCPDGTAIIATDIPESSITLTTPTFTKRVFECFAAVNNQPETPKPPEPYFELSRQLRAFAKMQHWL
jgi:Domain of unknown function (DUF6438)